VRRRGVACWPAATLAVMQQFGSDRRESGQFAGNVKSDGRALQENFADLAVSGLASMYPTFDWSVAPGHHGYQRAGDLISGKASRRPNGSPVLARAGRSTAGPFHYATLADCSTTVASTHTRPFQVC
jgi:hypothetical protein